MTPTLSAMDEICGEIVTWNGDRGFGFARRDDGQGDVFVHINSVRANIDALVTGQRVSMMIGPPRAVGKSPNALSTKLLAD